MKILLFLTALSLYAQVDHQQATDVATVSIGRNRSASAEFQPLPHPYRLVARHPKAGCADTATCGEIFYEYEGHNLRTTAGTVWQSELMGKTTAPTDNTQANYMGLTNTAITPAFADTTLSGLITTLGLACAQGTYLDGSGVIAVPGVVTANVVGTTGAVTYFYWVMAVGQGISTTLPAVGTSVTTANATLSTTAYQKLTFTGSAGATSYNILRTTSSTPPSGTSSVGVSVPAGGGVVCDAALACVGYDQSNTLVSATVPASNLTNYGHYTLIKTWTATGAVSAQAFGIFTNSACTSNMRFEGTFTPVSLNTNDTFQLTETVQF